MLERIRKLFSHPQLDRSDERRVIRLGNPFIAKIYCDNEVKSSKYNIATFVPMNIFRQFKRPINMYFLVIALLQFVPNAAPVSPFTTIFPITFAFSINIIKEAIDDFFRHQQDEESNSREYTLVDPSTLELKQVRSKHICVGDLLVLKPFEIIPCDVVVLATSCDSREALISTECLDGETGAKQRLAVLQNLNPPLFPRSKEEDSSLPLDPYVSGAVEESADTMEASPKQPLCAVSAEAIKNCVVSLYRMNTTLNSEGPNPFLHSYHGSLSIQLSSIPSPPRSSSPFLHLLPSMENGSRSLPITPSSLVTCHSHMSSTHSDEGDRVFNKFRSRPVFPKTATHKMAAVENSHNLSRGGLQNSKIFNVGANNIILASSRTLNTPLIFAMVVFTGMETKVNMTHKTPHNKWATIEKKSNLMVIVFFVAQILLTIVLCVLACRNHFYEKFWYLGRIGRHPSFEELVPALPLRFLLLLSSVIPLSFKVMVEISKAYISSVIRWDEELKDNGFSVSVNNSALVEDLGQVEYIFTDKTGTLTNNTMLLKAIGTADGKVYEQQDFSSLNFGTLLNHCSGSLEIESCGRSGLEIDGTGKSQNISLVPKVVGMSSCETMKNLDANSCLYLTQSRRRSDEYLFWSMVFCNTVEESMSMIPPSGSLGKDKNIASKCARSKGAFELRALCNSAEGESREWISCSPDEVALVNGASHCGVKLLARTPKQAMACFWNQKRLVRIIKILYFSSQRGRMSILVQRQDDKTYVLLTKGADEKVLPLCTSCAVTSSFYPSRHLQDVSEALSGEDFLSTAFVLPVPCHEFIPGDNDRDPEANAPGLPRDPFSFLAAERRPAALLERFSHCGFRTLVHAFREIGESEVVAWLKVLEKAEARTTESVRLKEVTAAYHAMERDLVYCGCTAVEDKLQSGVPETILQLRQANIHMWMLTGDKRETARQTAIASGLLSTDDHLVMLTPPVEESMSSVAIHNYIRRQLAKYAHYGTCKVDSSRQSWWKRAYSELGLKNYVEEFTKPLSLHKLIPYNMAFFSFRAAQSSDQAISMHVSDDSSVADLHCIFSLSIPRVVHKPNTKIKRISHADEEGKYSPQPLTKMVRLTKPFDKHCPTHIPFSDLSDIVLTDSFKETPKTYSIMLSGTALGFFSKCADEKLQTQFVSFLLGASTVICSRASPDQKALIVDMIKKRGKITLAVGDGGNDVAMIETAHVGVGIKGKEGSQAARSADFAVSQFRFLSRLLLVHGHTAYYRTAMIVQQSFWKSILLAWVQVLFNIYAGVSAVSYWDSFSLIMYNMIPTVPVTFLYVMDMPLAPGVLMGNPHLYCMSQRCRYFNPTTFYGYALRSLLHGTVIYYLAMVLQMGGNALHCTLLRQGWSLDRSGDFYVAYLSVITVHTYTALTESHSITFFHWQSYFFSVYICFLMFSMFALFRNSTFLTLLTNAIFYFSYIAITACVCLSLAAFATLKVYWFPSLLQYQRTVMESVRRTCEKGDLLYSMFEDSNPSLFWGSLFSFCFFTKSTRLLHLESTDDYY